MLECLGLIVVSNWQPFKDVVVAKSKFHCRRVGVLEICFPDWCLFVLKPFQMSQHENHYPGHNIALEISHLHFIFSPGVAKSAYLLVSLCFHRGCHFKWTFSLCATLYIRWMILPVPDKHAGPSSPGIKLQSYTLHITLDSSAKFEDWICEVSRLSCSVKCTIRTLEYLSLSIGGGSGNRTQI